MAYGTIKVDTITFTDGGVDKSVSVSGLVENPTFTGNVTATGTISGDILRGQAISGVTVTGTTAQFTSGTFVSLTGTTLQGTTATYTTGSFTSLTGTTTSGTTANFVSGVFSTQISGVTVTGTTANFTSGNFTNISGGTHTITSGVFALGTAANPSISFVSDPNTGLYSPGADQVAISTNGTGRLFVDASGRVGVNSAPSLWLFEVRQDSASSAGGAYPVIQVNNPNANGYAGVYLNDSTAQAGLETQRNTGHLGLQAGGAERLRITSTGLVGVGTSSPGSKLHVAGGATVVSIGSNDAGDTGAAIFYGTGTKYNWKIGAQQNVDNALEITPSTAVGGTTFTTPLLVINSAGNVGIGTTSPNSVLQVNSGTNLGGILVGFNAGSSNFYDADLQVFRTGNGTERARIDSSGRLLVGTSSALSGPYWSNLAKLQVAGSYGVGHFATFVDSTSGAGLVFQKSRNASVGGNTIVSNNDLLMDISIEGNDGTGFKQAAVIQCQVDGTPGANDMPGRLVFSTTADGASSPTERMRITNGGAILLGKTTTDDTTPGFAWRATQYFSAVRGSGPPGYINRLTDDGVLLEFAQDNTIEGTISVSGTTVSYNGAHLSRWSQLPGGAERAEILRGTVLSNIDEMCEWGEEDNEQLNRMKVSDVEGDKNVSGVFQGWDDDDDTYTDDFYCAMTGDFIIRISAGIPVHRGQLLMSAGDGTAKPQDDDIIRSKTIAKVTSNHVTCTYDDGSYCVPCVLMAC
jgi:hypothetical protein